MFVTKLRHETLRQDWHVVTKERNALAIALAKAEGLAESRLEIIEKLEDRIAYQNGQIDAKDAALLDMRREGFDPQQVAPTAQAPAQEPKDPLDPKIQMAIEALAEPGSRDAGIMADDARLQLAAGRSLEAVIDSIERGSGINPHRL